MKRIFSAILIAMLSITLLFGLTSCTAATESTDITITDLNGAGTRSIRVSFPTEDTDNEHYFPKGMDAAAEFLNEYIDNSFNVSYSKSGREHVFSLSFSFDSLDEHIEKLKLLIGEARWEMLEPELPQIVFSDSQTPNKMIATYYEPYCISHACTSWAYEALINDGVAAGVFDIDGRNTDTAALDNMYDSSKTQISITFLGNTEHYSLGDTQLSSSVETNDDGRERTSLITAEGITSLSPPEGRFEALDVSAQKAIIFILMASTGLVITSIGVAALLLFLRAQKKKHFSDRKAVPAQTEFSSTRKDSNNIDTSEQ